MPAGQEDRGRLDCVAPFSETGESTGVERVGVLEGAAVAEAGEACVAACDGVLERAETEKALGRALGSVWVRMLNAVARRRHVVQIMAASLLLLLSLLLYG